MLYVVFPCSRACQGILEFSLEMAPVENEVELDRQNIAMYIVMIK
jgi:hypothetical protein